MIEIFVAKTVEEAKEQAIAAFAAPASEIRFEVLEEPKKGLFGMRRGEAKVRAEYEPLMQQTPVKRSAPAPEKGERGRRRPLHPAPVRRGRLELCQRVRHARAGL